MDTIYCNREEKETFVTVIDYATRFLVTIKLEDLSHHAVLKEVAKLSVTFL